MSMSFAMHTDFNEQKIPKPKDKNIRIGNIENQRFIAITFSGRSSDDNFEEYQEILVEKIKEENIEADLTSPIRAYYNYPWTMPFLKRKEVLFIKLKKL